MEREITLSSLQSKTWPVIILVILQQGLHLQLNLIMMLHTISVLTELSQFFLSWTNVNSGYNNQKIAFSKDIGKTFKDIDFAQGVWT